MIRFFPKQANTNSNLVTSRLLSSFLLVFFFERPPFLFAFFVAWGLSSFSFLVSSDDAIPMPPHDQLLCRSQVIVLRTLLGRWVIRFQLAPLFKCWSEVLSWWFFPCKPSRPCSLPNNPVSVFSCYTPWGGMLVFV